jgi:hypothetical protein
MAITVAMRTQVSQLYVSLFGRAPDGEGLGFWVTKLANGTSLSQIAQEMFAVDAARAYYPAFATNGEIIATFYKNVLGRSEAEGEAFWTAKMNAAANKGDVFLELINVIVNFADTTNADGMKSKALFNNKVAVAQYYGEQMGSVEGATAVLAGVTDDVATVAAAKLLAGKTINLSVTQDTVTGTSANDVFVAKVVQNANGEQTNQLGTGDQINGGAGTDTLNATVIMASPLNQGPSSTIRPVTVDVENVQFTALSAGGTTGGNQTVSINAAEMIGLDRVHSLNSDASLAVYNLTTLTNSGNYADKRDTDSITLRMDHSGNLGAYVPSSMTVLFDGNYLLAGAQSQSRADFFLLDQDADLEGEPLLSRINVDGLRFTIDGGPTITLKNAAAQTAETHAGFVAALQTALNALITDGTLPEGSTLTVDTARTQTTFLDDGSASSAIPAMTLKVPGKTVVPVGFSQVADALGEYNVYGRFNNDSSSTVDPVTSNIELMKVGRGSDGGDLTVGGMSTDFTNTWNSGSGSKGVQQFNITVFGDASQPSKLSSLQSTNNTLQVVNISNATGSAAALVIGNNETSGGNTVNGASAVAFDLTSSKNTALKDVKYFNAENFANNLTVHGYLSDEVVAKYMNRTDTDTDPSADNTYKGVKLTNVPDSFEYNFGGGNDLLNLNISKSPLAANGTVNREDFEFTASMGAGNDTVEIQIGDGAGIATDPWYVNMKAAAGTGTLTINAGAGNDTVRTWGSSAWEINAGSGNDRVYTDNSGAQVGITFNSGRAAWVLNSADGQAAASADRNVATIKSAAAATTTDEVANVSLTVNFFGITQTVNVGTTHTNAGGIVTDLVINQAIKAAIQGNVYLSGLLVAEDGPGRTLIVRSLVDGEMVAGRLAVSLSSDARTDAQTGNGVLAFTNALANGLGFANASAGAHAATTGTAASRFASVFASEGAVAGTAIVGEDSDNVNSNTVVDGTGTDLIVLSTNAAGTEIVNLTADGEADVIFNVTNAKISGLGVGDKVVLSNNITLTSTNISSGVTVAVNNTGATFTGTAGADTIVGTANADVIIGGAGADVMTGGAGADTFVFATGATGVTLATADTITDFTTAVDLIETGIAGLVAADVAIADGTALANFAAFVTAAEAAFAAGDNVFVAWNVANISAGNALVAINSNGGATFTAGDTLIVLTGINAGAEIDVTDFA